MIYKAIGLICVKILSACFIAVLISFIGQVLIGYGYFSFMFIFLTVFSIFFTLTKKLRILGVLLVNLLFIMMLLALRIYILIADKG